MATIATTTLVKKTFFDNKFYLIYKKHQKEIIKPNWKCDSWTIEQKAKAMIRNDLVNAEKTLIKASKLLKNARINKTNAFQELYSFELYLSSWINNVKLIIELETEYKYKTSKLSIVSRAKEMYENEEISEREYWLVVGCCACHKIFYSNSTNDEIIKHIIKKGVHKDMEKVEIARLH